MAIQQTEANLWQELRDGIAMPQATNLKRLCELLDWAIAQLPENQQLEVAGWAIEQMAEIYTLRFNLLMGVWEETDALSEETFPVLDLEALEAWIRQSMSIDLDALVEQPTSNRNRERQPLNPTDSVAAVVEPEAILQMVEQIEAEEHSQMIRQLAGEEDPARWSAAITRWLHTYAVEQPVRLVDFYQELEMPLVEVWIGLLLGGFELEQHGQFYELPGIWICSR
jgi:hypothetical protein